MNINNRMFSCMKAKKITQEHLATKLDIRPSVIGNWKTRGTTPPMEYLPIICEVLGVSWEYLVTGRETEQHFTSEETYLVEQYRKVLPEGQKDIQKFIEYQIYKCEGK